MAKLDGQPALVVGAGQGPGRQAARHLSELGATLALNDLLPGPSETLAAELADAQVFPADAAKKLAAQTLVQDVLQAYGRIDLFVFAAAVQPADSVLDMDEWDWRHALDRNLTSAFLLIQSIGRVMREQGGGRILVLIGQDVEDGTRTSAAYRSASAALNAMAETANQQLAAYNISVQAVEAAGLPGALNEALKE